MTGEFQPGARVVVTHPTMGRTYGTVERLSDQAHSEPVYLVRADGGYINAWSVPLSILQPATCQRDMVIGDLLNLDMLKEVIEVEFLGTLWTKGDSGMMTPYVCECSFGDGLKLLTISTINQRPNYHVVRVHSGWDESNWSTGDNIGEHIDEIIDAIEEECGSRYWVDEDCDKCDGYPCHCSGGDPWPAIEAEDGCSWGHIRWDWLMKAIGYQAMLDRLVGAA